MSDDNKIKLPLILITIGGGLLFKGLKNFRKSRQIQDTARINIGSAAQGLVEIEGYAWPMKAAITAVCGRQVVFYNYKVQELVSRGKNTSWETRYEFNHNFPFYVIDFSGVALVAPTDNCMDLTEKTTKLARYAESIEDLTSDFQLNSGWLSNVFSRSYRLVEIKIYIGCPIYLSGNLSTLNMNQVKIRGDYKKFLTQIRTMSTNPIFKMSKLDTNHDGILSDDEMVTGYSDLSKAVDLVSIEHEAKLVGTISSSDVHNLIVADGHESQYLKRLTSYNLLSIWGGVALLGLGLLFLVTFF